jgi:flagellar hook-length control protein FliK
MTSATFITDIALQRTAASPLDARKEASADRGRDFGRMIEAASRKDRLPTKDESAKRDETAAQPSAIRPDRNDTAPARKAEDASRVKAATPDLPPRRADEDHGQETASSAARPDRRDQADASEPSEDTADEGSASKSEKSAAEKPDMQETETTASDNNEKEAATAGEQAPASQMVNAAAVKVAAIEAQSLAGAVGAIEGAAAKAAAPAGPATAEAKADAGTVAVNPAGAAALATAIKSLPGNDIATPAPDATDEAGAGQAAAASAATDALAGGKKVLAEAGSGASHGASPEATAKNTTKDETAQATHQATAVVKELAAAVEGAKPQSTGLSQVAASAIAPSPSVEAPAIARPADPAHAMARPDAPVPLQAMAVEIGMRAMRGSREFAIRLDPEDPGRVDIKLEISEAGQVQAKLTVDKVETLQLLQRDARTLERAFDQAGLKTSPDGLQFSLRDPGQQNRQSGQQDRSPSGSPTIGQSDASNAIDDIVMRPAIYRTSAAGGLDIRI